MVRRSRLKRKRLGTLGLLRKALTSKAVQRRLASRKNWADYTILFKHTKKYGREKFKKNVKSNIHKVYPKVNIRFLKVNGENHLRVSNATFDELLGIHGLIGTFSVGGFKT
jgi:hypothetical protein